MLTLRKSVARYGIGLLACPIILVVAHRLASIRRADRIVVLEHGRIVESGPPERLLQVAGRCRQLFASQLAVEAPAA